jgi:hypothetical protein
LKIKEYKQEKEPSTKPTFLKPKRNLVLEKSKGCYQSSQKTLANTREKKADTNTIYDFFANLNKALNLSTAGKLIRSFDWRWIVVFSLGLVIGLITIF